MGLQKLQRDYEPDSAETDHLRVMRRGGRRYRLCWSKCVSFADDLRNRIKRFAFDVVNLVKSLPRDPATEAIARQLVRSGPGVCANHRAAGRARSSKEFAARLAVALEEADETEFWLEALLDCSLAPASVIEPCLREARELRAILSASVRTARIRSSAR